MKAVCPNNKEHKEFITPIHVMEDAKVDEEGYFIETVEWLQITHGPDKDNIWTCSICGAEAIVEG